MKKLIKKILKENISSNDILRFQNILNDHFKNEYSWWKGFEITDIQKSSYVKNTYILFGVLNIDVEFGATQWRNFHYSEPFPGNDYWTKSTFEDPYEEVMLGDIISAIFKKELSDEIAEIARHTLNIDLKLLSSGTKLKFVDDKGNMITESKSLLNDKEKELLRDINDHGVFEIAKYFGGIDELKSVTKKNPLVYNVIDDLTKGIWELELTINEGGETIEIPFVIKNIDEMMEQVIELNVDLNINDSNLTEQEFKTLSQFLIELSLDGEGMVEVYNDEISEYDIKSLYITTINNKVVPRHYFLNVYEPIDFEDGLNLLRKISF